MDWWHAATSAANPRVLTVHPARDLRAIGLRLGEPVRFHRHDRSRWSTGRVSGIGADGSILIHDTDGSARSMRPELLEVQRPGRRGKLKWRAVSEVATTWEQLDLFSS